MSKSFNIDSYAVILPSLNPTEKLCGVVEGLINTGFSNIILVDDGSAPEFQEHFTRLSALPQVTLLRHEVNRGKGAGLKTAFAYLLEQRQDIAGAVTADGDGQHLSHDILACAEASDAHPDTMVLGFRNFDLPHVPPRSRSGNKITNGIFRILCGIVLSDTQTGLRAIPRDVLETLVDVYGDRFEYETNMLLAFKQYGITFDEVKIRTVYIEENKSSHFRVIHDSWRIYKLILAHFFRYTLSSLISAVVDTGTYAFLSWALQSVVQGFALTAAAGVIARVISSLLNFFMNKKLVFQSKVSTGKAMVRYYMLALPQMAAQVLLTQGVYSLLGIADNAGAIRTVIYAVVMTALYFLSYMIQQRWVFAAQK